MITFTSEITERQMMKGCRVHRRTVVYWRRVTYLLCFSALTVALQMHRGPVRLSNVIVSVIVAVAIIAVPFTIGSIVEWFLQRKIIRQMPVYGQTVSWELDETGIKAKGDGFFQERTWALCFSATLTKDGILLYLQKNLLFYWWPVECFPTEDDFRAAAALVLANVKKVKIKDGMAGVIKI